MSCSTSIEQSSALVNHVQIIFARILDCKTKDIDIGKSFFEHGGTSLKALQLVALLQQEIARQIDIKFFFDHLSVIDLVQACVSFTSNSSDRS